jgi:hypothetical protein
VTALTGWLIFFGTVLFILAVLMIPVRAVADYKENFSLKIKFLFFFSKTVFPMKEKEKTEKPKEQKTEKSVRIQQAEKAFANYAGFWIADAVYTEEQALETLRRSLDAAKWADADFVQHAASNETFTLTREYLPVYRLTAKVEYSYKVKAEDKKDDEQALPETEEKKPKAVEKTETKSVEVFLNETPEQLGAGELSGAVRKLEGVERSETFALARLEYAIPVKKGERALMEKAAKLTPVKGAKIKFTEENYEVVLLPVLVATCVFRDRKYVSRINLGNGKCAVSYPVSAKLSDGVEKSMRSAGTAKLCSFFAFLYTLTFGVLALVGKIRKVSSVETPMLIVLFALVAVPILAISRAASYKRDKLIRSAKEKGTLPKVTPAKLWSLLAWAVAIFSAVLFALYGF